MADKKYQWYDVCFEYDINVQNFEKLLLKYIVPFIEENNDEIETFHFLHHKGFDLRFHGTEDVRMKIDDEFKDLEKYSLLKRTPYDNKPDMWVNACNKPDLYIIATNDFLSTTSKIIINLLIAKQKKQINNFKIYGIDSLNSKTLIPDFTHLLLNQLTYGNHLKQSEIFHKLSEIWKYSFLAHQTDQRTIRIIQKLVDLGFLKVQEKTGIDENMRTLKPR